MKVHRVQADARRKQFVVITGKASYSFPYALLPVRPVAGDPVVAVWPDKEIGCEGFTYRLRSGKEETLHLDAVLEYNRDPDYIRQQILYELSVQARQRVRDKRLSKRALARRLSTSPTQIYRLLDPTCYQKSIDQMIRLLYVLGARVDVAVDRAA